MAQLLASGESSPATSPVSGQRRRRNPTTARHPLGYALLSMPVLIILAFLVFPLGLLLLLALKDVQLGTVARVLEEPWTLANMGEILTDGRTWHSLLVSCQYVVGSVAFAFVIGFGTALLLNGRIRARRILRTLILVPWAIPGVTATIAFVWIMSPSFGVLNYVLRSLDIISTDINWFGSSSTAMLAVILPTAWKSYPFFTITLLAALQSVPREYYEAASVDGASSFQQFLHVTWPSIRRYAGIAIIFNAMYAFREFDFIFASTQGGPAGATDTIAIRIYNLAFKSFHFADAAALGIVTFVIVAVIVGFLLRSQLPSKEEVSG